MIDQTLTDLEKELDPARFFRANRQYIVNIKSIVKYKSTDQSKIKLELKPDTEVMIAKENSAAFRKWVKGN